MSSAIPPVPPPPPPVSEGNVGVVVGGGVLMVVGLATFPLPYLLFIVGGGGDTASFDEFARSFRIPGAAIIVAGVIVLLSGVVYAARRGVRAGRILSAVALMLSLFLPPVGLILGYAARSRSGREGGVDGLSTGAIVIGWVGTAIILLIAIFVALVNLLAMSSMRY